MTEMAANVGIKILGFSSDGDTRLLKAIKLKNSIPNIPQSFTVFKMSFILLLNSGLEFTANR